MLSIDNFVKQDSLVRFVGLFVDMLPLEKLGFHATPAQEGRPPYAPSDLLKLYIYGYKDGLRYNLRRLMSILEIKELKRS